MSLEGFKYAMHLRVKLAEEAKKTLDEQKAALSDVETEINEIGDLYRRLKKAIE